MEKETFYQFIEELEDFKSKFEGGGGVVSVTAQSVIDLVMIKASRLRLFHTEEYLSVSDAIMEDDIIHQMIKLYVANGVEAKKYSGRELEIYIEGATKGAMKYKSELEFKLELSKI